MINNLKNTFENFNKQISKKEVIAKTRFDNFNKFINLGFPNKKLEDWKFSDLNQIISSNIKKLKSEGYPHTQAVAIAMSNSKRSNKRPSKKKRRITRRK